MFAKELTTTTDSTGAVGAPESRSIETGAVMPHPIANESNARYVADGPQGIQHQTYHLGVPEEPIAHMQCFSSWTDAYQVTTSLSQDPTLVIGSAGIDEYRYPMVYGRENPALASPMSYIRDPDYASMLQFSQISNPAYAPITTFLPPHEYGSQSTHLNYLPVDLVDPTSAEGIRPDQLFEHLE